MSSAAALKSFCLKVNVLRKNIANKQTKKSPKMTEVKNF